jgi:hypothetical protein
MPQKLPPSRKRKRKQSSKNYCMVGKIRYLSPMTETLATFPSTPEEYAEYCEIMEQMADEAEASTPDPQPENFISRERAFYEL